MFKRAVPYAAPIIFAIVLSLGAQPQPAPAQATPFKRTILQRADVPETNLELPGNSTANANRAIHDEGALDKPVKLSAVYVVEKGKPLASPVQ